MDKRLLWELIFKEELEREPDANKPENQVRIDALRKKRSDGLSREKDGAVYRELEKQIRAGIFGLLQAPATTNCGCPTCQMVRGLNTLVEFWTSMEHAIEKGEK